MNTAISAPEKQTTEYPQSWYEKPFFKLTEEMLQCVSKQNFERLSQICDDDFGIIDINTDGGSEVIRDKQGWAEWFTGLFAKLKAMEATTWSEITRYESMIRTDMGMSVVDFDQMFVVGDKKMRFSVIATIVWKLEDKTWKEARWHSSLLTVKDESDKA